MNFSVVLPFFFYDLSFEVTISPGIFLLLCCFLVVAIWLVVHHSIKSFEATKQNKQQRQQRAFVQNVRKVFSFFNLFPLFLLLFLHTWLLYIVVFCISIAKV